MSELGSLINNLRSMGQHDIADNVAKRAIADRRNRNSPAARAIDRLLEDIADELAAEFGRELDDQ